MASCNPAAIGNESTELAGIFDYCPEMIAILSEQGRFRRASAVSAQTVGHPSATLEGQSFFSLVHLDDLAVAEKEFRRALEFADRVCFRTRFRASDGDYRWIEWRMRRPRDVDRVYAVARDITDHYSVEKELARANEILSTVLLSAPLPIWASDPDGRIQFWNQAAERILGWTSEEVLQGTPPDLLPICGVSGSPTSLAGEKRSWRRKDGSTRELRFWTAPLHENNAMCGILGMAVDVTEYDAELYDALQQAYDDLRNTREAVMQHERLRVLGQMASGIAHDINNALAPVKMYAQVLLEDETGLTERGRNQLGTISKAIADIAETVARLREFYRAGEPQPTLNPFDLNDLVQQVLNLTRARWRDIPQRAGVAINTATELAGNLPSVLGIESEIREAIINLIFNAVDAMPSGGTLTLRTGVVEETAGTQAFVEVADTGIGMDENTRRRCLEPFFTTKGERGTGLGLAMVYGILQRNNGSIDIESTPGKGTTMRLRLAMARSGVLQLRSVIQTNALPPLRVLVVDDDALVLQVLRHILERDGHQVTTAEGGEAGIAAFHEAGTQGEPFDVVLTDLGMPYIDGQRVASAIKAESPSTPIVLLTGWGRRLMAEGEMPPDVDQLLSKPADVSELRQAMARCFPLR